VTGLRTLGEEKYIGSNWRKRPGESLNIPYGQPVRSMGILVRKSNTQ
jgi:hypothetical protein